VDEVGHFFRAQDTGQGSRLLRIRCIGHAPGFLDRLRVEEPQRRESLRHGGRGKLSLAEQIRLVLADVLRSELIRRAPKVPRKILDRLDVAVDGSLSVITTLEFFEHHFAKVVIGDLLMTQPYPLTGTLPTPSTRKRLPLRLRSNGLVGSDDQIPNGLSASRS